MTMTEHNVKARNLRVGDQIQIMTLMHTITEIEPDTGNILLITAECQDEIGFVKTEVKYFVDRIITVFIPQ